MRAVWPGTTRRGPLLIVRRQRYVAKINGGGDTRWDCRASGVTPAEAVAHSSGSLYMSYHRGLAYLQGAMHPLAHQEIAEPVGIISLRQLFEVMRAPTLLSGQSCQGNGLGDQHEIIEFQTPHDGSSTVTTAVMGLLGQRAYAFQGGL